jgi:ABC-2 type transport system permease protein
MSAYLRAGALDLQTGLRYKVNSLLYLPVFIVPALAASFLWRLVLAGGRSLGGYDLAGMVTYYLVTQFFVANTPFVATTNIGESIRDGSLATWLVRPIGHYGLHLARTVGMFLPLWVMGLAGVALVSALLWPYVLWQRDPLLAAAALAVWLGGVAVGYTIGYLLNLLSFWVERVSGWMLVAEQVAWLSAGVALPLDLLPLPSLWLALPFRFAGWLPAQVYLGKVPAARLPAEAAILLLWLAGLLALTAVVWRLGLRRFQGAGG